MTNKDRRSFLSDLGTILAVAGAAAYTECTHGIGRRTWRSLFGEESCPERELLTLEEIYGKKLLKHEIQFPEEAHSKHWDPLNQLETFLTQYETESSLSLQDIANQTAWNEGNILLLPMTKEVKKGSFYLTANHIVNKDSRNHPQKFQRQRKKLHVKGRKQPLYNFRVLAYERFTDLAFGVSRGSYPTKMPAFSEKVSLQDKLYIVPSAQAPREFKEPTEGRLVEKTENFFLLETSSQKVKDGNYSGAPIAKTDGTIVGFVSARGEKSSTLVGTSMYNAKFLFTGYKHHRIIEHWASMLSK